jgi:catechol 2,3-dioxygenase-like lactoylglutathione lyase family enzyme
MAPAEPFRLSKIALILLGVSDVEKSIAFYKEKLGLKLTAQFEGFAFFDTGGATLGLSRGLAQATNRGAGATEVVFSVDHVRVAYQALRDAGVPFSIEPRQIAGQNFAANFNDPDGHGLSIFGPE